MCWGTGLGLFVLIYNGLTFLMAESQLLPKRASYSFDLCSNSYFKILLGMKESPNLIILSLHSLKSIRHGLSPPLSPENITQWLKRQGKSLPSFPLFSLS